MLYRQYAREAVADAYEAMCKADYKPLLADCRQLKKDSSSTIGVCSSLFATCLMPFVPTHMRLL